VDKCIEAQVFQDLPWAGVMELVEYALVVHKRNDQNALVTSIKEHFPNGYQFSENWLYEDTPQLRTALAKASIKKDKDWFKRIDHGQFLGSTIFKHFDQIDDGKLLKKNFVGLNNWIDN